METLAYFLTIVAIGISAVFAGLIVIGILLALFDFVFLRRSKRTKDILVGLAIASIAFVTLVLYCNIMGGYFNV